MRFTRRDVDFLHYMYEVLKDNRKGFVTVYNLLDVVQSTPNHVCVVLKEMARKRLVKGEKIDNIVVWRPTKRGKEILEMVLGKRVSVTMFGSKRVRDPYEELERGEDGSEEGEEVEEDVKD